MTTARARAAGNDQGMIAIAILVSLVVLLIGGAVAASVAWQASAVSTQQREFHSMNMATNALTAALDTASQIDPRSNPDLTGYPTGAPGWTNAPQTGQQYRWWYTPTGLPTIIEVTAEGRAGGGEAATVRYTARLRFDYTASRWTPTVVRMEN